MAEDEKMNEEEIRRKNMANATKTLMPKFLLNNLRIPKCIYFSSVDQLGFHDNFFVNSNAQFSCYIHVNRNQSLPRIYFLGINGFGS